MFIVYDEVIVAFICLTVELRTQMLAFSYILASADSAVH